MSTNLSHEDLKDLIEISEDIGISGSGFLESSFEEDNNSLDDIIGYEQDLEGLENEFSFLDSYTDPEIED